MQKKRVFLTRTLHNFALKELKKKYQIEIHTGKIPIPKNILKNKIKTIDGLICFPYDKIDNKMIDLSTNLKVISTFSVGFDHIDINHAKKKKIRVGYTPKVLTDATADLAFALMIDLVRRVSEGDRIIRNGKWRQIYGAQDYVGMDLQGKTLGILGMGRIGSTLAKRAKAFEMNVIAFDIVQDQETADEIEVDFVSLDELAKESDFITCHVPLTPDTKHIVNKQLLEKMKNV